MKPILAALLGAVTILGTVSSAEANAANGAYERVQKAWAEARGDKPRKTMPELISEVFGLGDDTRKLAKTPAEAAEAAGADAPAED